MRIRNIIFAAAASLLAACSNSDDMPTQGSVALQVNATITNAATRLGYAGTSFASGTTISLFADGGTSPTDYTVGTDGVFAPSSTGYMFNTEEEVSFTACCPALTAGGTELSVNTATQSDDLDILFAKGKASIYDPELNLNFSHVMSKLTFNLYADDGVSEEELQDVTVRLTGIVTDGTFNTSTGVVTAGSTTGEIAVSYNASTYDAEAIVVPQSTPATFVLKVTINKMDYTIRLTTTLAAGNKYFYPVGIKRQTMSVGTVSIVNWTDEVDNDAIGLKYQSPIKTITNKADVRKYDYLMKDGTFMRVPSEYLSSLSDSEKENIAGVVFWIKPADLDEELVGLGYTNGLVVSMNEYTSQWMATTGVTVGVTNSVPNLCGYSNTKNLKEYNNEHPDNPVLAVSVFADEPNVTNTSGWYLPSSYECMYIYGASYYINPVDYSGLNNYLTNKIKEMYYWTCQEDGVSTAIYVFTNHNFFGTTATTKTNTYYVRPICAF